MSSTSQSKGIQIEGKGVALFGAFPRVARLRSEHHEYVENPPAFIAGLKNSGADLLTFLPQVTAPDRKLDHPSLPEKIAVLTLDTYENWWKKQVNDKTRNMVRKAGKKGVTIQQVDFSDELAQGIHAIYNESPIIQGKPSKHFGKDFETIKKAHATFLDRSVFVGAYVEGKLIGFIKFILHPNGKSASLMQINSLVAHRDKSPTNAILAKAIEICAERGITHFQYGVWSRRTLGDFKKHHGFALVEVPRYFVPLNWRGRLALGLGLHRRFLDLVPGNWQDSYANLRTKWYLYKYRAHLQSQGL
jgi:hypothetical protein